MHKAIRNWAGMAMIGSAALALTACGDVLAMAGPQVTEEFNWNGSLSAGQTLEIKGVNGTIEAMAASGSTAEVVAIKKGRRMDPSEVAIEVVEHAGGITLCAVYPSRLTSSNECAPGDGGKLSSKNSDVEVEFVVQVPSGVNFVGKTINGGVKALGLDSPVWGSTVNGSVRIDTASYGWGSTVNGSVDARLGSSTWAEDLSFTSVNGSITVELPETVNAEVEASCTNGRVKTDFDLTMPKQRWNGGKAYGTLGAGGPTIEVKSVNGSVRVLRAS